MSFAEFNSRLNMHVQKVLGDSYCLFKTDADPDTIWDAYLNSFPKGTNPLYRVRTEHDCSCCRNFLRTIGPLVWIDDNLKIHSLFEFDTQSDVYQPVADAIAGYVTYCGTWHPILGRYYTSSKTAGTEHSLEVLDDGSIKSYDHFFIRTQSVNVYHRDNPDVLNALRAEYHTTVDVFHRSLDEISLDAVDTVLELIDANSLYRGEEFKTMVATFRKHKVAYDVIDADSADADLNSIYCWRWAESAGPVVGRIKNSAIGTLLLDITNGIDLDTAVRKFESVVAPANYKRPDRVFTQKMLDAAKKEIENLGYMDSLPRRFATTDDITPNNVLFVNKSIKNTDSSSVFDDMSKEATVEPKKFSRIQEIGIESFVNDVLPHANDLEVYLESRHTPNLMSLIAPVDPKAPSMFKWNNAFSWSYTGNIADSDIRENVKSAGGKVDGVLRFSIQWNDGHTWDQNDLDAHCVTPNHEHIYFRNKYARDGGNLDVDIINPLEHTPAVENITWPKISGMATGTYQFYVNVYSYRMGVSGFRAEIECDGVIHRYESGDVGRSGCNIRVADVVLDANGKFTVKDHLKSTVDDVEMWGIKSNRFIPVSAVMYSPNYWDEQDGIGNKHYFFFLKDCLNPGQPNGFYNEFLKESLMKHRRVFEALGSKMAVAKSDNQLSGLGFSSTLRNNVIVRVKGAVEQILRVNI